MASPNTEPVSVRVSPEISAEIRSIAEREQESPSTIIRRALRRGLEQERIRISREATS
jgi:predicted transcriptional regulator